MVFVDILIIIVILIILYLLSLRTNPGRGADMEPFERNCVAHRGLFENGSDHPENSEPAFKRAVEYGYGAELDVQLTSDGYLVVFHDDDLERMCGVDKILNQCTLEELRTYDLKDSTEKIPLFEDVLKIIDGKIPLIIEVKPRGPYIETAEKLSEMMEDYEGIYCVESFNPKVVAWYRRHHPEIIRGQLSMNYIREQKEMGFIRKIAWTNLLLNFYGRPDFIAYDCTYIDQFSYRLCRKLYSPCNALWTIQSQEQIDRWKGDFQIFIFDSFYPPVNGGAGEDRTQPDI